MTYGMNFFRSGLCTGHVLQRDWFTGYNLAESGQQKARPTIVTDRAIEIVKDDVTYSIPSGTTKSLDFTLSPGENRVRIIGTATVSFEFYKEMI